MLNGILLSWLKAVCTLSVQNKGVLVLSETRTYGFQPKNKGVLVLTKTRTYGFLHTVSSDSPLPRPPAPGRSVLRKMGINYVSNLKNGFTSILVKVGSSGFFLRLPKNGRFAPSPLVWRQAPFCLMLHSTSQNITKKIAQSPWKWPKNGLKWRKKKWAKKGPKLCDKGAQKDPKMRLKRHQNDLKMMPKRCQNDTKVTPKWPLIDPRNGPKGPQNDPTLVPKMALYGPR